MKTNNIETKLESQKDQFLATLKATKLAYNLSINSNSVTYEPAKGKRAIEECSKVTAGLRIMLDRIYHGNVEIHFSHVENETNYYRATLYVLADSEQAEAELTHDALLKITQFLHLYTEMRKRQR